MMGLLSYIFIVRINLIYVIYLVSPTYYHRRWGMTKCHTLEGILGSLNVGRTIRLRLPHPYIIKTFFSWKIYIHKKLPLTVPLEGFFSSHYSNRGNSGGN
jgi:hypothetical protein